MKLKNSLLTASVILLLLCKFPGLVHAQVGPNDPTFNPSDVSDGKDDRGATGAVFSTVNLPNGKILIGGNFTTYNGTVVHGLARLNANGSLDATFHSGLVDGDAVNFILLQPNNQLIIGGTFKKYNGVDANQIARLNTNGSLDESFNSKIGTNGTITKAVLESSGKIIIIGNFTQYNSISRKNIARLRTNGGVDLGFNYTDTTPHEPTNLALQTDGKPVVTFRDNSEHNDLIVRLNTNGGVDPSFVSVNPAGDYSSITLNAIAIQANGKIVVGGLIFSGVETLNSFCERVNTDGTRDLTFNPTVHGNRINNISIQSNGKIVVAGFYKNNYIEKPFSLNTLDRLNTDGTTDATFNNYSATEGYYPPTYTGFKNYTTSLQPDGKIILGGFFTHPQNGIIRLNSDGGVDINFNKVTGANGRVKSLAIQSNGKILIGGAFSSFNGTACNRFTRLNESGSLDTKFNNKLNVVVHAVNCIALQADQKIIVGGAFTLNNGTQYNNIARLNTNGAEDATFNTGNVILGNVFSINVQTDGKILVSGSLDSYNGTPIKGIIRLNKNGTLDPTFVLDNTIESSHMVSKLQSDGKIIVGNYEQLHRLNADGSLDASFHVTTWFEFIEIITVQNDGKIIVGGNNPVWGDRGFIIRLNTDGSTDDAFEEKRNLEDVVSITSLSSKKIIVGRGSSVTTLNPDGTLDSATVFGFPDVNALVWCSAQNADGSIIIGGDFTSYGGVHRNGIARALQTVTPPPYIDGPALLTDELETPSMLAYPNPATYSLTIDNLASGSTVTVLNSLGQVVNKVVVGDHKTIIETSSYQSGIYFIQAEHAGKTQNAKFIVNK